MCYQMVVANRNFLLSYEVVVLIQLTLNEFIYGNVPCIWDKMYLIEKSQESLNMKKYINFECFTNI